MTDVASSEGEEPPPSTGKSTVATVGPSGRRLHSQVVETNAGALIRVLRGIPGTRHLCLEEGTHANWLYEVLSPHVEEIVVAAVRESRGPKSEGTDAQRWSGRLRPGGAATDRGDQAEGLQEAGRVQGTQAPCQSQPLAISPDNDVGLSFILCADRWTVTPHLSRHQQHTNKQHGSPAGALLWKQECDCEAEAHALGSVLGRFGPVLQPALEADGLAAHHQ